MQITCTTVNFRSFPKLSRDCLAKSSRHHTPTPLSIQPFINVAKLDRIPTRITTGENLNSIIPPPSLVAVAFANERRNHHYHDSKRLCCRCGVLSKALPILRSVLGARTEPASCGGNYYWQLSLFHCSPCIKGVTLANHVHSVPNDQRRRKIG